MDQHAVLWGIQLSSDYVMTEAKEINIALQ